MGDLSGPVSSEGVTGLAGFQAAIDAINARGGVDGIKIDMSSPIDTQSTTSAGVAGFRQALSQSPIAILASLEPSEETSAESLLSGANIPVLSVTESDTLEGIHPQSWAYTANLTGAESANSYVQYLTSALGGSLKGKKVAIVVYDSAGPIGYMDAIASQLKGDGASVVAKDLTEANTTSFAPQAAKIMQSKPDAVVSIDVSTNTVLEVQALQSAGFTGPFAAGPAVQDATVMQKLASIYPSVAVPLIVQAPATGDLMTTTAAKYRLTSQAQGVFFTSGWVLAYALAGALKKCGANCTAQTLTSALNTAGPFTVPGNVAPAKPTFSATKHVIITSVQFTKWDASSKAVVSAGPQIPVS